MDRVNDMVDYHELMRILSVPRPNGSRALRQTSRDLQAWLSQRNIPYRVQTYKLRPYFLESIGVWLVVSRTLLAVSIWLRWGWPALWIAAISLPGGLLDVALNFPLVTRFGAQMGENILIELEPRLRPARQELVFSAHYDSKSEILDHRQRMFFLKNLRTGIFLTIFLGVLGPIDHSLLALGTPWASLSYVTGIAASLALLTLAWGLGLNLVTGRLAPNSQGAVDNGAACAILAGLADCAVRGELDLNQTRLVLALFSGEEVNMQGSRAYVRSREWPIPAVAVNLEVMAQDGDYVYWEEDGSSLKLAPTSPAINQILVRVVSEVTAHPPQAAGPVNSDGGSFLMAGIPAGVLGTYDSSLVDRGFHQPTDNLGRVVMRRLPEGVEILARLARGYDRGEFKLSENSKET